MKKQEILENTVFPILRKMNNEITDIWYQKEGNREYAIRSLEHPITMYEGIASDETDRLEGMHKNRNHLSLTFSIQTKNTALYMPIRRGRITIKDATEMRRYIII